MTDYHVRVRDYHWSHHNIVVQSPILDLNASAAIPIIRPLEGINKHEPRIIDDIADLKDDISNGEYRAEAHGVFVATDPRNPNRFPVWVPVQDYGCKAGKVHVVNLTSFEASHASTAQICWIPGHKGPDGSLYTVIGAPRETIRATKVLVIVQKLGQPREARVTIVDPTKLTEYGEVDKSQKKVLFEIQSWFIQTRTAPPSTITLNAYRVLFSPNRDTRDRLALEVLLDEDLEVPRASHSDCSSQSSFSSSSGDEDSIYVKPKYVSLVEGSNRSYDCDCKHAALLPTYFNPRPSHRHGTDAECSLGSSHTKHCIFADHRPEVCVISGFGEQHEHCVVPSEEFLLLSQESPPHELPSHDLEAELKSLYGESCFAQGEALIEEAERGIDSVFDSMDSEPSYTKSPSITPQPAPSTQRVSTCRDKRKITKRLQLRGPSPKAKPAAEAIWNARLKSEAYGSPEPKDMVF